MHDSRPNACDYDKIEFYSEAAAKKNYEIKDNGSQFFIKVGNDNNYGYLCKDGKVRDWNRLTRMFGKGLEAAHILYPSYEEAERLVVVYLAAKKLKRPKKEGLKEVFRADNGNGLWTDSLTPNVPYLYLNKTTNTYYILYWVNKWFDTKWYGGGWYKNPLDKLPSYDWDGRNERVWELPGVKYDAPIAYSNKR